MANQRDELPLTALTTDTIKRPTTVTVTTVEGSADHTSHLSEQEQLAWQPGFRARFPWLGFACLSLVVVASVLSIVVLVLSNRKPVSRWDDRVAPNVLLSVLSSASSICITLAVGQGIAIAWWRKALHGATVKELHHSWAFESSLSTILLKYKYFNVIALAALVTKLAIVDGVLYQRSTSTYLALGPVRTVNITTYPTETFPATGWLNDAGNDTDFLETQFTFDLLTWLDSPQGLIYSTYGFWGCGGTCFVEAPALGLEVNCTMSTDAVDIVGDAWASVVNSSVNHPKGMWPHRLSSFGVLIVSNL